MGILDPSVYVVQIRKEGSNDEEPPNGKEDARSQLGLDFSTPSETFFLCSSLTPEEELVNNLSNIAIYHAMTKRLPKTTVQWEDNRWYGIMIDIGAARGNTAGKA